ncbi:cryptochrome/photolyase family protein [Telmatospirillum siberiense]|uniref:cryptochrome/photolyase family protein n=1 Tax=Telmatospirillum siberiense TaxID=382514 RepID=UPI001F52E7A9|nr:deoxyribodipyrimidine photo-lyase [Telmatospirillum siberiense]
MRDKTLPAQTTGLPLDPNAPIIVWFRRDLRVVDNPALSEAAQRGQPIIPLYILEEDAPRPLGGAARWWLHHSLKALCRELTGMGSKLILRRGRASDVLLCLARESGARTVLWNRRYDRMETGKDCKITSALVSEGIQVESFTGSLLFDPRTVRNRNGQPFRIFTPFWRCCLTLPDPPRPLPRPRELMTHADMASDALADWRLPPEKPDWSGGIATAWTPGEDAAGARLADFLEDGLCCYAQRRDHPDQDATSRLSPHLAFGEISPRQVWYAARTAGCHPTESFLRELGWREFCHHTLYHAPDLASQPQRGEFQNFPWATDEAAWQAFTHGRTGYPIVDAGMRALWETGWLHNRLRMIVASFLVKDLLIPWQRGEAWFWDTLVDADPASNAGGWQWVAGCGLDAAPYFRIFNPVLQGEKFDPHGRYIRRWIPELGGLPDNVIHRPWEASAEVLAKAGLRLGKDYPTPIVEHGAARLRALAAYERMKNSAPIPGVPEPAPEPDTACRPRHW